MAPSFVSFEYPVEAIYIITQLAPIDLESSLIFVPLSRRNVTSRLVNNLTVLAFTATFDTSSAFSTQHPPHLPYKPILHSSSSAPSTPKHPRSLNIVPFTMADMDIEMDLDIAFTEEDLAIPEIEPVPDIELPVGPRPNIHYVMETDIYTDRCA